MMGSTLEAAESRPAPKAGPGAMALANARVLKHCQRYLGPPDAASLALVAA